jgi:hypothetical protein
MERIERRINLLLAYIKRDSLCVCLRVLLVILALAAAVVMILGCMRECVVLLFLFGLCWLAAAAAA